MSERWIGGRFGLPQGRPWRAWRAAFKRALYRGRRMAERCTVTRWEFGLRASRSTSVSADVFARYAGGRLRAFTASAPHAWPLQCRRPATPGERASGGDHPATEWTRGVILMGRPVPTRRYRRVMDLGKAPP